MQHPDEGTIHAWLDGELAPDESAALEAHVASCAECSAAVAEARGLIAASSRILTKLDDVPAGVIPGRESEAAKSRAGAMAPVQGRPARQRTWWTRSGLAAAAVVFVAAGTWAVARRAAPGMTGILSSAQESSAPAIESIGAKAAPVTAANSTAVASRENAASAKDTVAFAKRAAPPAATPPSGAAGRVAAVQDSRARQLATDSARPLARRSESDQSRRAEERFVPTRPAAPAPAPALSSPLAESAVRQDAAAKRELREAKPTENVVTTGMAVELSARDARSQKSAAASGQAGLQQTAGLAGCYDVRLVPAGGAVDALQSAALPSRIALDSVVAPEESDPTWWVARDVTAQQPRLGRTMGWRPVGPQSFELIVRSGASAQLFRVVLDAPDDAKRTDEVRVPAPASAGGPVLTRATRVACPR